MKILGIGLGAWAIMVGLVLAITFTALGVQWLTADSKGATEARTRILSADTRIVAYNHFFNACSSIQGLEGVIAEQEEILDDAESTRERERIRTNIAGAKGLRLQAIAKYNGDAEKDYTIGQFRDLDLPFHLDSERIPTRCAS